MAFVPLNTNNSNLANYNSVNSLMLDYQGFKKTVSTSSAEGWVSGVLPSVSSVAYNGNRSYDITFAGPVDTYLSPGMRLKTVRQVAAPTQCTSLNGSTQYYSKTSPTGLTFTTTFTCSAWIKLSSYAEGGIIARRNADTEGWAFRVNSSGQLVLAALRIASNNKTLTSYQSVPLNKWVHVAATFDVSAGDTTAQKMWIDGVEVPRAYGITGTITALVQGTTALVVGAAKSAGDNPFPGKIAQAAVFSSQLSDATVKSYYSQGLSGTETNLVSAYSFNNSITDLNTTNANNLTAQGSATATDADSPFSVNGSGAATGTDDYAIVTKVTSTVATVLVPEGNTITTSGGISATYISTQKAPYNMPIDGDKWHFYFRGISWTLASGAPTQNTYYGGSSNYVSIPIGVWDVGYQCAVQHNTSSAATSDCFITLSTTTNSITDDRYNFWDYRATTTNNVFHIVSIYKENRLKLTNSTTYYLTGRTTLASMTNLAFRSEVPASIWAKFQLL